jgi:hypothetical protein
MRGKQVSKFVFSPFDESLPSCGPGSRVLLELSAPDFTQSPTRNACGKLHGTSRLLRQTN